MAPGFLLISKGWAGSTGPHKPPGGVMHIDLEYELLTTLEAAQAAMHRAYAAVPGLAIVNMPGVTPDDDVALALADNGLPVAVWLDTLRRVPAGLPVCVDGHVEDAADWVTALERMPSGAVMCLDALPDAAAARHDRLQLVDALAALVPAGFTPSTWAPPAA